DNFGNLILEKADFSALRDINSYIYSMNKFNCTRTLYYVDILASTERNHLLVKAAVEQYKREWIYK
ncbi:hypothetical protein ACFL96_19385, partial [Thermoproteota archaeon]